MQDGVDIALIQEPWQKKGKVMGLHMPGYTTISPPFDVKVRTCIVLKHNLNYLFLLHLSCPDLTAVSIEVEYTSRVRVLLFPSAYLPYDSQTLPPWEALICLVQHCSNLHIDLVVGADANAHHICWGSSETNQKVSIYLSQHKHGGGKRRIHSDF